MFEPSDYTVNGTRAFYCFSSVSTGHSIRRHDIITNCTILTINPTKTLSCYSSYSSFVLWKKLKIIQLNASNIHMVLPKNLLCFLTNYCYKIKIVLTKPILVIVYPYEYNQPVELTKNLRVVCILNQHFNQRIELPKNLKYFQSRCAFKTNVLFPKHLNFMGICGYSNNQPNTIFPENLYGLITYDNYIQLVDALNQDVRTVMISDKCAPIKHTSTIHANLPSDTVYLYYNYSKYNPSANNERMKFDNYVNKLLDIGAFNNTITFNGTFGIYL